MWRETIRGGIHLPWKGLLDYASLLAAGWGVSGLRACLLGIALFANVSAAQAESLSEQYRTIYESWLGGSMVIRCDADYYRISKSALGGWAVDVMFLSKGEWKTLQDVEVFESSINLGGIGFEINEKSKILQDIRDEVMNSRPVIDNGSSASNYTLEPYSQWMPLAVTIDFYSRSITAMTLDIAYFTWKSQDAYVPDIPAKVDVATHVTTQPCVDE